VRKRPVFDGIRAVFFDQGYCHNSCRENSNYEGGITFGYDSSYKYHPDNMPSHLNPQGYYSTMGSSAGYLNLNFSKNNRTQRYYCLQQVPISDNDPMLMVGLCILSFFFTRFFLQEQNIYVILLLPFSVASTVGKQITGMPIVVVTNIVVVVEQIISFFFLFVTVIAVCRNQDVQLNKSM
jgi:hypothetical protein